MRIIDFHTHLDDRWFDTPLLTAQQYINGLDRLKIDHACIFTIMGFYEDCPKHNDLLAAHARANPGRLFPFVTVDPKLGKTAVAELERCIEMNIFRGIKFHPWLQSFAPSMVKGTMIDILKRAAEMNWPVLYHDGTPPYATTFQAVETARWVEGATIVLGHAGLADYTQAAAQAMRDLPNVYGCLCGPRTGDLKFIIETAGVEKCLFGSDYGLSDYLVLQDRLNSVLACGLSEGELDQVLFKTSARLLRID